MDTETPVLPEPTEWPAPPRSRPMVWVVVVAALAVAVVAILALANHSSSSLMASEVGPLVYDVNQPGNSEHNLQAHGKPCVAEKGQTPAGAPAVPVQVGPPPTKLVIKDLKTGTGNEVKTGATVTVDYVGVACSSGQIFDTSFGKQPIAFPLTGVIPGFRDGLVGMKVGGSRLLGIPPDQGYGDQGAGSAVPPGETLWFVVNLVKVS